MNRYQQISRDIHKMRSGARLLQYILIKKSLLDLKIICERAGVKPNQRAVINLYAKIFLRNQTNHLISTNNILSNLKKNSIAIKGLCA